MATNRGVLEQQTLPCQNSAKVLLIDDDKRLSEVVEALLTAEGYAVNSASDGLEGLSAIRKHNPSVVVLDIQMPHMDGIEVLSRMRSHPHLQHIPVILASAERGVSGIAQRFSHTSAIQKPFDLMQLVKMVNTTLATRSPSLPEKLAIAN
jgi:two-component system NtrC family response regulator/two-component system nitrogen regulation response regulator GlnG